MSSPSRVVLAVGLVVLVAGSVTATLALVQGAVDPCESGYGVHVQQVGTDERVDSDLERVEFEDLPEREQAVFEAIVTAETTPLYPNRSGLDGIERSVVTYRGDQYEVSPIFVSDCFAEWEFYQAVGGLAVALGGSIAAAAYGWRRWRERTGERS